MIFDTHAHYDDEAFDPDREGLLKNLHNQGIDYIVNVGASIDSIKKTLALAKKYPFIYAVSNESYQALKTLVAEGIGGT